MKNEYETIFGAAEAMSMGGDLNNSAVILAARVIEDLQEALERSRESQELAAAEIQRLYSRIADLERLRMPHDGRGAAFVRDEFRFNPGLLNTLGAGLFDALAANYPHSKLEFIRAVRTSTNWDLLESKRLADFIWD